MEALKKELESKEPPVALGGLSVVKGQEIPEKQGAFS